MPPVQFFPNIPYNQLNQPKDMFDQHVPAPSITHTSQPLPTTGRPTPSINTCPPVQSTSNITYNQLNICQPVQNSNLTYAFNLRKPTPSTIPRTSTLAPTTGRPTPSLNDSTDIGFVPVPLADLLVPKIDSQYTEQDTLEDTDSKMSELPKD